MSLDFNIREYQLTDMAKFSSAFFNKVTNDFLQNILSLYKRFQRLYKTHNTYKLASESTINWLVAEIGDLTSSIPGKIRLSGYSEPLSSTNIKKDSTYGQLSLLESSVVSKIPLVENEYGEKIAIASCEIKKSIDLAAWYDITDLRNVINGNSDIWYTELDPAEDECTAEGYIYVRVKTTTVSESDDVSYITVFPLMGTIVKEIKYNSETISYNTAWPVKMHRKIENYGNEVTVKLKGKQQGAKFLFALREIGVYKCEYSDTGVFTYDLDMNGATGLSSILIDEPYIIPTDLAKNRPFTIKIKSGDLVAYDTSKNDRYPLEQNLLLDTSLNWIIEVTIKKIENISPVITGITLEKND